MVRLDLAFLLCCCKAILGPLQGTKEGEETFYHILGVEKDASPEDIKRAYKKQSLLMHPDKLVQRGKVITDEDRTRFTRMKEAYEVLSDPHKRETYDAVGERGMKWLHEPYSIDPRELANNFATSSTLDKSKIFAIFIILFVAILLVPVLVCLQADHVFGNHAQWIWILLPLWIWNGLIIFYHIRVIHLGPIPKPEDIPEDQWVDPLPMNKRYIAFGKFILIVSFEVALALQLDQVIHIPWRILLVPFLLFEGFHFLEKMSIMTTPIITVQELELKLGKSFNAENLTSKEKEFIKQFFVVPSLDSLEYLVSISLKRAAKREMIKVLFRSVIILLVGSKLDEVLHWTWWAVFSPLWILFILTCCGNFQYYVEISLQAAAMEEAIMLSKADRSRDVENQDPSQDYVPVTDSNMNTTSSQEQSDKREEIQEQLALLRKQFAASCCSQSLYLILLSIMAAKLEGASFSSIWLISPLILFASIILCVVGCAIYGFNVPTRDESTSEWDYHEANESTKYSTKSKPTPSETVLRPRSTYGIERDTGAETSYISPIIVTDDVHGTNTFSSSVMASSEPVQTFSSEILIDLGDCEISKYPSVEGKGVQANAVTSRLDEEEPGIIHTRQLSRSDPAITQTADGNESIVTSDWDDISRDEQPPDRYIHDLD